VDCCRRCSARAASKRSSIASTYCTKEDAWWERFSSSQKHGVRPLPAQGRAAISLCGITHPRQRAPPSKDSAKVLVRIGGSPEDQHPLTRILGHQVVNTRSDAYLLRSKTCAAFSEPRNSQSDRQPSKWRKRGHPYGPRGMQGSQAGADVGRLKQKSSHDEPVPLGLALRR